MAFNPPSPELPTDVFTALHGMAGYDGTAKAFKDSNGALYYMFLEKVPGGAVGQARWAYGKLATGAPAPRGLVPQTTYDIIKNGTQNQDLTVAYGGSNYRFELQYDSSLNDNYAVAVAV